MDAIKIEALTKQYKHTMAVDHLNLTVRRGELLSLLGVNGAGKTTTLKMLSCLTRPTGGDAFIEGLSITTELQKIKKILAVSPQETAVAPNLTVRENLQLMAGVYELEKKQADAKITTLIQQFGLREVLEKRAGKLSGGWQRRLSIAMALVGEPKLLFLDEPTLGLDVLARDELWETIRALKGKMTLILTTHYMEEAEALSDHVAIMKGGRLLATGTPEEIKERAGADRFSEAFVRIVKGENS